MHDSRGLTVITAMAAVMVAVMAVGCASEPEPEKSASTSDALVERTGWCSESSYEPFMSASDDPLTYGFDDWSSSQYPCGSDPFGTGLGGGGGFGETSPPGSKCPTGSGCSNQEIQALQAVCRYSCALPGIDSYSRGVHACKLLWYRPGDGMRMVNGDCDCASGFDIPAQAGVRCDG